MDNELLLYDRLEVIRKTIEKYGEDNFYLSFSGGKDSTVLHYLLDEALPNNKIPRLYLNTGIEYTDIYNFVREMANNDERIIIKNSNVNIKKTLEEYGYPFKSKEHSQRVYQFNKGLNYNYLQKYINGYTYGNGKKSRFACLPKLKYQFNEQGKYNYSHMCCFKMKKEVAHNWEKQNNKKIVITGMRAEEGGNRRRLGCIITDSKGKLKKFHPLIKVDDEWEDWYIKERNIKLCRLYYSPFNFERTGCKGCPFTQNLQEQLEVMERLLPNERKQCELIWKPVYEEYRRLGYRLKKVEQVKIL